MGALLVAAQVQERIAVAGDGFPTVFLVQSLELGQVLDDDGGANLTGAHGGQGFVELLRQGHVGELVQDHPHMDGEPPPVHMVGLIVQLLDDLGVEHTDEVRKRGIVVGNDGEYGCLPLPDLADVHIVVVGDGADLIHIERRQPDGQRDVDALGGLARRLFVDTVLLDRDMVRVVHAQVVEQHVQGGFVGFLLLLHIRVGQHPNDHAEVLLVLRRFVQEVEHQSFQQRGLRLLPEGVTAARVLRRGVADQVRNEPQHILIVPDIAEGIVPVRSGEVHQVEHPDRVPLLYEQMAHGGQDLALGVGDHIAAITLHDPRQSERPGLARAATAQGQDVQVPPMLMGVHADLHMPGQGEAQFLRQLPVQFLGRAPFGGAMLLPLPKVRSCAEIDQPAEAVQQQAHEDAPRAVGAPLDLPRGLYPLRQPGEDIHQAPAQARSQDQREPDRRDQEDSEEQQVLPFCGVMVSRHIIKSTFSP